MKNIAKIFVSTVKNTIGTTVYCAKAATGLAIPVVAGKSVYNRLAKGKWKVKDVAKEYVKGAAITTAVMATVSATSTIVTSTIECIKETDEFDHEINFDNIGEEEVEEVDETSETEEE